MAKLKGPLFSLGASGSIGEAIVYFGWKGLNVAREYVVPANPKTTLQNNQRARLTAAVALLRVAQIVDTYPFREEDAAAYALWGSTYPTPRTWFNQWVKHYIDLVIDGKMGRVFRNVVTTPGTDELVLSGNYHALAMTAGNIKYGTSKTALMSTKACSTVSVSSFNATLTGLTTGVKYYWQFEGKTPGNAVGVKSGIYYGYPT